MEEQTKQKDSQNTIWYVLVAFLLGVIAGFFIAPIKAGMKIGCENGTNSRADVKILNKELKHE